ncbi:hypothetical protein F7725_003983 [Dissostichus mawsoni]|uniref:Uncharacterized protein n=1 Tax=Dissostichus mawsoni TaxID=36200 RepID=A0A7J5YBV9_DISMA|nr:hypothetical protein F7725_003983 [Dissostichus mawsoni]
MACMLTSRRSLASSVPCIVLQLLQLRLHLLQLLLLLGLQSLVQRSGQSQSFGLLLPGLGLRSAADGLPLVVQVHGEVVQLLLQAGLCLLHLVEAEGLLLQTLPGQLQVLQEPLLRLLQTLHGPTSSSSFFLLSDSCRSSRGSCAPPLLLLLLLQSALLLLQLTVPPAEVQLLTRLLLQQLLQNKRDPGHELLQLRLHLLPLVLRLGLVLLQKLHLAQQILVGRLWLCFVFSRLALNCTRSPTNR